MEAAGIFEMSLDINQTTWHHIPEDTNLHQTCHCENLTWEGSLAE
jgi:hypothetical protein